MPGTGALPVAGHEASTGDIYRSGNTPPAAPDVAGINVSICRVGCSGGCDNSGFQYTHIIHVPPTIDIRDRYSVTGTTISQVNPDSIWIPDKNGGEYYVRYVQREGKGTPNDNKKCFIQRRAPTWPTDDL